MGIFLTKCTTNKYAELYVRWLKNPGKLLDLAEFDPAKDILLDLCGGTGAVANEALRRGANEAYLLDLNPRSSDPRIITVKGDAHNICAYSFLPKVDVCVIRQSLGYLDLAVVSAVLAKVLEPGARLAINGFLKPRWKFVTYKRQLEWFLEASGHFLGRVAHIQASFSGVDFSVFQHHPLPTIYTNFEDYFDLHKEELTERSFRMVMIKR